MKRGLFYIISAVVLLMSLVLFFGCDNETYEEPGEEQLQQIGAAFGYAFGAVESLCVDIDDSGIGETGGTVIITWDCVVPCVPPDGNVTINGTLTVTLTETSMSITGTLTFTGDCAPVSELGIAITITETGEDETISGYVSIDGTKYNAASFDELDLDIPIS
jgi:hypothetical protein